MNEVLSHHQLKEIATEFSTPVYIYHAEKIAQQYQKLQTAFSGQDVRIFYASKALTNLSVLQYIRQL
ncbi:MAG: diaminopimelate decarboxylase, partial [Ginsengibacter sp.]